MSKFNEIIDKLEKSCVDFDYIDEESTTIASWVTFGQILGILNKLRPYVELGEYCFRNWVMSIGGNIIIEGVDEFSDLIQQIKEME